MAAWSLIGHLPCRAGASRTVLRASNAKRSAPRLRNPFKLLGLDPGAEKAALRPAFKKLAATVHPDVPGTGDAAAFQQVLWAYQELSNTDRWHHWSQLARGVPLDAMPVPYEDAYVELCNMWPDDLRRKQDELRKQDESDADALDEFEARLRYQSAKKAEVKSSQADSLRKLIQGPYEEEGENYGRPTFRKADEGQRAAIYYWAERDGADCDGWWIGADVGGDVVFAFNINQASMTPPATGWRFPLRGPVDNSLQVLQGPPGQIEISFAA